MLNLHKTYILNFILISLVFSQISIPESHHNLGIDNNSKIYINYKGEKVYENPAPTKYTLENSIGNPIGTKDGLSFNFNDSTLNGTLYYGFIPYGDSKHPMPVFFKSPAKIKNGRSEINIKKMGGRYDMIRWEEKGKGTIGYRVVNAAGMMIYNGIISFRGKGPFQTSATIIEGPIISCPTNTGVILSFVTNIPIACKILVSGREFKDNSPVTNHEIKVNGLMAGTVYNYRVICDVFEHIYSFKTSPQPGSRKPFVFSYASDSRSGQGGGERNVYGTNYYIMRKIMALSMQKQVAFMQFTGDMINGYLNDAGEMDLHYANWKSAITPYSNYLPVYVAMGNHESFMRSFGDSYYAADNAFRLDGFPYETFSSEALFAKNFVNHQNGPNSEDNTVYDPNPKTIDFPSYKENVYFYTYNNVAVIVMNTDYWYTPSTSKIPITSGGVHGYIMDAQLAWIEKIIATLESDQNIDHIFITGHTPFFPNGGHITDDMWYSGNNEVRPYVTGKPVKRGIIERRDDLLNIFVNKSKKVVAILTGDEHNYNKLEIGKDTEIYLPDYTGEKVNISRTIYQINNGAAGAPYYAQEKTPWTSKVSGFTTQNALVFFYINGKQVRMEVINPETLEQIDHLQLR